MDLVTFSASLPEAPEGHTVRVSKESGSVLVTVIEESADREVWAVLFLPNDIPGACHHLGEFFDSLTR